MSHCTNCKERPTDAVYSCGNSNCTYHLPSTGYCGPSCWYYDHLNLWCFICGEFIVGNYHGQCKLPSASESTQQIDTCSHCKEPITHTNMMVCTARCETHAKGTIFCSPYCIEMSHPPYPNDQEPTNEPKPAVPFGWDHV